MALSASRTPGGQHEAAQVKTRHEARCQAPAQEQRKLTHRMMVRAWHAASAVCQEKRRIILSSCTLCRQVSCQTKPSSTASRPERQALSGDRSLPSPQHKSSSPRGFRSVELPSKLESMASCLTHDFGLVRVDMEAECPATAPRINARMSQAFFRVERVRDMPAGLCQQLWTG